MLTVVWGVLGLALVWNSLSAEDSPSTRKIKYGRIAVNAMLANIGLILALPSDLYKRFHLTYVFSAVIIADIVLRVQQ